MNDAPQTRAPQAPKPLLILGIGLILIGILAALDNLGIADMHIVLKLWPLILIFMGVAKLRQEPTPGAYALVIVGTFLLIVTFGHRHVEDIIGPMVLVGIGIFVILKGLHRQREGVRASFPAPALVTELGEDGQPLPAAAATAPSSDAYLSGTAILTGYKRRVYAQDLRGGDFTSIFGGFEVDLRRVALQNNQATVDVFVLFGGGKIMIPQDWQVDVRATAIAGAVEDKTLALGEAPSPDRPRLIITGTALFGGVEISH
jgi:hypothetical protein